MKNLILGLLICLVAITAHAQNATITNTAPNYGTTNDGSAVGLSQNRTGGLRVQPQTGGADTSTSNPMPVTGSSSSPLPVVPGNYNLVTLDVKTVTTGGTAVTALIAGHHTKGGWLQNPVGASVALCINEIGTASGTTSNGDTTCIQPGAPYNLAPNTGAVSVISSDSSHPFSGVGFN